MNQPAFARRVVLTVITCTLALSGLWLWLRLTSPSDGARLLPGQAVWSRNGVVVTLAIIASTFLIGLLFKPLHGRTQTLIDRRFYRRKYDAARTLATFSTTIRDEVDLNQLCTKLIEVVEETMQPTQVSLWLRPPEWQKEGQPYYLEAHGPESPNHSEH